MLQQPAFVSYVTCTSTSAAYEYEYRCSGSSTPVVLHKQFNKILVLLYALAQVSYAATIAITLLMYDGASSKRKGNKTQPRASIIISSTVECRRVSLPVFGVVFVSPPEILW